jgi:hypothetical protein
MAKRSISTTNSKKKIMYYRLYENCHPDFVQISSNCLLLLTRGCPVLGRSQGWTGHIRRWDFSHGSPLAIMTRQFFAEYAAFTNFFGFETNQKTFTTGCAYLQQIVFEALIRSHKNKKKQICFKNYQSIL